MSQRHRSRNTKAMVAMGAVLAMLAVHCTPATGPAPPMPTDVGPSLSSFPSFAIDGYQSVSGRILALAVAPSNAARLYASAYSGVWRSDDAGGSWRQLVRPQPAAGVDVVPGGLPVPTVTSITVAPSDPGTLLISTNGDSHQRSRAGVYRSSDGGSTWALVQPAVAGGPVGQVTFAPDDGATAYAALGDAIGVSADGGVTWKLRPVPQGRAAWHVVAAPRERGGTRRVYAAGDPNWIGYSTTAGATWQTDPGAGVLSKPGIGFGQAPSPDPRHIVPADDRVLAVEPGHPDHVYLAAYGGANGPGFFFPTAVDGLPCDLPSRPACGRGSLWFGDFSGFAASGRGTWTQVPGPAEYGGGSTRDGGVSVVAMPSGNGYVLLFIDGDVKLTVGRPASSSAWHRLDGPDASADYLGHHADQQFIHPDYHAVVASPDLSVTLGPPPPSVPAPYNENSVVLRGTGRIWIAEDGGVATTANTGATFSLGAGLSTLAPIDVAGLPAAGTAGPVLMMGMGDNADFASSNGGALWAHPHHTNCGDCGANFADPLQPDQLLSTDWLSTSIPRQQFQLYRKSPRVDPVGGPDFQFNCPVGSTGVPIPCVDTATAILGNRPIVYTLPTQAPAPEGDFIALGPDPVTGATTVMRTLTAPAPATWTAAAPDLPAAASAVDVLQASGGHSIPTYLAGDPDRAGTLWRSTPAGWSRIVPGPGATRASRFFVDPYDPNVIYILDSSGVERSDDGGRTWRHDGGLDAALTEHHAYAYLGSGLIGRTVMQDVVFVPGEPGTRIAVGIAGVFITRNGTSWTRLLDTTAVPCYPEAAFFDAHTRLLYVATDGRGLLRFGLLP